MQFERPLILPVEVGLGSAYVGAVMTDKYVKKLESEIQMILEFVRERRQIFSERRREKHNESHKTETLKKENLILLCEYVVLPSFNRKLLLKMKEDVYRVVRVISP